jgi:hypothetical protein
MLKSGLIKSTSLLLAAAAVLNLTYAAEAVAAISFVGGTNSVILTETINDEGNLVFVFDGTAVGERTVLSFSTDSACPGVAMAGGAEFDAVWSCSGGVITASLVDRGGLSFGPGPEGTPSTFYVTFSNPPTPPGAESPPTALTGIQISVFGDINRWDLDGSMSANGAVFGIELSGPEGGEAHFRMDLPQTAADFLGGVLGVFIGGKPDPFASVVTNPDNSVSIDVDIDRLAAVSGISGRSAQKNITKKISAGARQLSVGFDGQSAKTGKRVAMKVCSGSDFASGDKVTPKFTLGRSTLTLKKVITLDSTGCGQTSVSLKGVKPGTLSASVSYKGSRAKAALKVVK